MNSFGHRAAHDFVDELVALARLVRIEINLRVPVLAAAAGLANVLAFGFGVLADGLAIRHLRLADVGFDFIFAHHAVDDDFEMQLAHAADDGLPAVGIGVNFEGRIFLRQSRQRHAHLFLIGLGLGLDGHRNYRHRKHDRLERDRMLFFANRVASTNVSEADHGADVARENFLNVFALVGVHLEQTPNALVLLRTRVHHRLARLQLSGIHADKRQLADKRVGHDLERPSAEKGSLSSALRVIVLPVSGSRPCVSLVSSGEGR
jgi:hypothetical protein